MESGLGEEEEDRKVEKEIMTEAMAASDRMAALTEESEVRLNARDTMKVISVVMVIVRVIVIGSRNRWMMVEVQPLAIPGVPILVMIQPTWPYCMRTTTT